MIKIPWIIQEERKVIDPWLFSLVAEIMNMKGNPKGRFEYAIFKLGKLLMYYENPNPHYAHRHDIVYAAHHASEELKRKEMNPYEDCKELENGSI